MEEVQVDSREGVYHPSVSCCCCLSANDYTMFIGVSQAITSGVLIWAAITMSVFGLCIGVEPILSELGYQEITSEFHKMLLKKLFLSFVILAGITFVPLFITSIKLLNASKDKLPAPMKLWRKFAYGYLVLILVFGISGAVIPLIWNYEANLTICTTCAVLGFLQFICISTVSYNIDEIDRTLKLQILRMQLRSSPRIPGDFTCQ